MTYLITFLTREALIINLTVKQRETCVFPNHFRLKYSSKSQQIVPFRFIIQLYTSVSVISCHKSLSFASFSSIMTHNYCVIIIRRCPLVWYNINLRSSAFETSRKSVLLNSETELTCSFAALDDTAAGDVSLSWLREYEGLISESSDIGGYTVVAVRKIQVFKLPSFSNEDAAINRYLFML